MINGHQKTLAYWRRELIRQNTGSDFPDGRSLHGYHLNDAAFDELGSLLVDEISKVEDPLQLDDYFSAAFVVYAAEWWRRFYDGGGYKWQPIFGSLNLEPWQHAARKKHVRDGLKKWKLRVNETRLRYIGSVAVQGGLPVKLIASATSGIGDVLDKVMRMARGKNIDRETLEGWVENLREMLPKTYQQPSVYALLVEFILSGIELGEIIHNTSAKEVVDKLNREKPGWRASFPVSVRDKAGNRFIERFVTKASTLNIERVKRKTRLERMLIENADGIWNAHSQFQLPEEIRFAELEGLFPAFKSYLSEPGKEYPRKLTFELHSGDEVQTVGLRKLAGQSSYLFSDPIKWGFLNESSLQEHTIKLLTDDGMLWVESAPKGDRLNADESPWLFVEDGDEFRFIKQKPSK